MKHIKKILSLAGFLMLTALFTYQVLAEESEELIELIQSKLAETLPPGLTIQSIENLFEGELYQVELSDDSFLYFFSDSNRFILGELYRFQSDGLVNLTDEMTRTPRRMAAINVLPEQDMIIFSPPGKAKATITVFTDVDCGYCRKFHRNVSALNEQGVEVRYLAFPRSGLDSESADKLITAWCSEDPKDAITRFKMGESLPQENCENQVAKQYELGKRLGVTGTPTILDETGRVFPGYAPTDTLLEWLDL